MNTIPIRTDVSPANHPNALDPEAVTALDVESTLGTYILRDVREALATLYTGQGSALDVRLAATKASIPRGSAARPLGAGHDGNREVPREIGPDGRMRIAIRPDLAAAYVEGLNKTHTRVAQQVAAREKGVRDHISQLETRVASALKAGVDRHVAIEIRAHVKGLTDRQRSAFLENADLETVEAVLAAPAYLSGLDDATRAAWRLRMASRHAPLAEGQRRAAETVLEHMIAAHARFLRWVGDEERMAATPAAAVVALAKGMR